MDTFTRLMQELTVLLPPILSNYWNMSVPTFLTHALLLSMYLPRYKYMFGHLFSTHRIRNDACWFRFSRWKFYFFIFAYSSRKDNLFLITYITPADFCLMTQVWQYVRFPQFFHSLRKKKISKKFFSINQQIHFLVKITLVWSLKKPQINDCWNINWITFKYFLQNLLEYINWIIGRETTQ